MASLRGLVVCIVLLVGLFGSPSAEGQNANVGFRMDGLSLILFDVAAEQPDVDKRAITDSLSISDEITLSSVAQRSNNERSTGMMGVRTLFDPHVFPDTLYEADDSDPYGGTTNTIVLATSSTLVGLALHRAVRSDWWSRRNSTFRFIDDWDKINQIDKFGHIWSTAMHAEGFYLPLRFAGASENEARYAGLAMAYGAMVLYEVSDGFGPEWGFSISDMVANTLGAGIVLTHHLYPSTRAYQFKAGFWPSGGTSNPFKDYDGMTFWLTANLHDAMGQSGERLPEWFGVGLGYAVRDTEDGIRLGRRELYAGLDFTPQALLPDSGIFGEIRSFLDLFHLPAPAVRIAPNPQLFLLFTR